MPRKVCDVWAGIVPIDRVKIAVRPMIIVEVLDAETVEVVSGSETAHASGEHWLVLADSELGRQMGLTKTTYFWNSEVHVVDVKKLDHKTGECPYDAFLDVESLVFEFHRLVGRGRK